jgi:hypothetical protein
MKTLKLFLLSLPLIFLPRFSQAQDFHMSQYDMLPLYYNPAQTGVYFGAEDTKYRFCGTYRSQWQKLQGKPYSSIDVGYDMTMKRFGVGVIMMDHIAGTSNFSTFQFLASGSYKITSEDSKKTFSLGWPADGTFPEKIFLQLFVVRKSIHHHRRTGSESFQRRRFC